MSVQTDRAYLRENQYRDATNLNARVALHARFSTNDYGWYRWVGDQIMLAPGDRLLELGCGPGGIWPGLLPNLPAGVTLCLTDLSTGMVDTARKTLSDALAANTDDVVNTLAMYAVDDAAAIPFPDESFDAVVANHMLYHVPDLPVALDEIRRVLRPDGTLYATTIGRAHLSELDDLLTMVSPGADPWGGERPSTFLLDNGQEALAPFFSRIDRRVYDDGLAVTDTDALLAYALSTAARSVLDEDALEAMALIIDDEIATHGAFHITKESGMFVARV
jgi:ubiquinone/menaquinone biosynthesis C-methylase UbiE